MHKQILKPLILIALVLILASCSSPAIKLAKTLGPTQVEEQPAPATETSQKPEAETSQPAAGMENLPPAFEYNLGETTITQAMFPEDSRFRNMPVRLNGVIATPDGNDGPYPVVLIMHGNHPGCPFLEENMVDRWPCDPDVERPNYQGYEYLVRRLAAEGYVALSINVNAENTFGFGEPVPIERLQQLVDLHLTALSTANSGGQNNFGVELKERADLNRLAFIGHSQGGEGAYWLTQEQDLGAQDAFTRLGYGPVYGILMVAPSANFGGAQAVRVPLAVILPACDNDVFLQDGQLFYEITRLDPQAPAWASSVWLESANHNYFNSTLKDEALARPGRPDCEPLLQAQAQRDFLSEYAIDFLAEIFSDDPEPTTRLGMDVQAPAPDELYGLPARVASLAPFYDRFPVLIPADETELETNRAGGSVTAEGVDVTYCKAGYYVPAMVPGSEPCKRVNLVIPGNPAMLAVSWPGEGGALRFSFPDETDLSQFTTVSLRAAVDPLSTLNKAGENQAFTIQLVDGQGNTASVRTRIDEPALRFPVGNKEENDSFDGGWFTGRVTLTTIRLSLGDFKGVDLATIRAIAVLFDQSPSGALFLSDLEFVR